jgi:hypothetical protein
MTTELSEALTAAGVTALIQKQIDPLLLEYQRRYSPLVRALPSTKWGSDRYFFNTRTSRVPGGFVTDGGARPVGTSVYAQAGFDMKHLQAVGAVTGFAEEVTRALIGDLRQREIEGAVQGLLWDIETGVSWGNAGSTLNGPYPQFDGLDTQASTFAGQASASNPQNAVDAAAGSLSLGWLDTLIDLVEQNAAAPVDGQQWMFIMSSTAASRVAQLLTNQQRFEGNVPRAQLAAGFNVPTYRDVPFIKSSFLNSRAVAMTTIAGTPTTGTGTLTAATYKYEVSAVIARMGETVVSNEVSVVLSATGEITLSFTPPAGFENGTAILYKVYRTAAGGGTGTETLLGYVDANVGLAGDGVTPIVTTSIIDNGAALVPMNGATAPATPPTTYFGTNAGHLPRAAGGEDIYLISRIADNVIRPYVRDVIPVDVYPTTASPDTLPFALVSDTTLAVRAPKYLGRLRNVVSTLTH